MGQLKVYNGSSFITALGKVWDGSAWVEKMNFFDGSVQVTLYPTGGGSVVLSGEAGFQDRPGLVCHNGFQFRDDGSIDEIGPLVTDRTQVDPGEWWSTEPDAGRGASYEIRALSAGAVGSFDVAAAADDVWVSLSGDPAWRLSVSGQSSPASKNASRTFEIRVAGSGSAIDSATFSVSANN